MNDYGFGNLICNLRKKHNLTQSELALKLDVSNKAVSKWENGKSKPTIDTLKKLCKVFDVSIQDLLDFDEDKKNVEITKIVLTGGPCAGKTTAMSKIQSVFTEKGYRVLFVPETATELISGGVTPWSCGSTLDFQKCVICLQLEKEKLFEEAAKTMGTNKVLIVCDRGALDGKAYMSNSEFLNLLKYSGTNEIEVRDNYDAVFHLTTAAKGAEKFYSLSNNSARTESIEQAKKVDDKLIEAWTGHPHFRVINNETDFDGKIKKLIAEISTFLGEPIPYEIERKFLIEFPNLAWLETTPNCRKVEIIQTYLKSVNDDEIRVRQRGENGYYTYTKTTKTKVNGIKRIEVEKRLSQSEYLKLLMDTDTSKQQIRKTRYCLTYNDQYFEIDIYPFWKDKAIVEIELKNEDDKIEMPKELKVIKEVTNDENYKNSQLANINNKIKY